MLRTPTPTRRSRRNMQQLSISEAVARGDLGRRQLQEGGEEDAKEEEEDDDDDVRIIPPPSANSVSSSGRKSRRPAIQDSDEEMEKVQDAPQDSEDEQEVELEDEESSASRRSSRIEHKRQEKEKHHASARKLDYPVLDNCLENIQSLGRIIMKMVMMTMKSTRNPSQRSISPPPKKRRRSVPRVGERDNREKVYADAGDDVDDFICGDDEIEYMNDDEEAVISVESSDDEMAEDDPEELRAMLEVGRSREVSEWFKIYMEYLEESIVDPDFENTMRRKRSKAKYQLYKQAVNHRKKCADSTGRIAEQYREEFFKKEFGRFKKLVGLVEKFAEDSKRITVYMPNEWKRITRRNVTSDFLPLASRASYAASESRRGTLDAFVGESEEEETEDEEEVMERTEQEKRAAADGGNDDDQATDEEEEAKDLEIVSPHRTPRSESKKEHNLQLAAKEEEKKEEPQVKDESEKDIDDLKCLVCDESPRNAGIVHGLYLHVFNASSSRQRSSWGLILRPFVDSALATSLRLYLPSFMGLCNHKIQIRYDIQDQELKSATYRVYKRCWDASLDPELNWDITFATSNIDDSVPAARRPSPSDSTSQSQKMRLQLVYLDRMKHEEPPVWMSRFVAFTLQDSTSCDQVTKVHIPVDLANGSKVQNALLRAILLRSNVDTSAVAAITLIAKTIVEALIRQSDPSMLSTATQNDNILRHLQLTHPTSAAPDGEWPRGRRGDLSTNDLTIVAPQQQQKFVGKVIKGKTSKYRGVTQTSKTSWGAKYSAKRITNTCKTPEEAAHAYDEYLKANYPQKFAKFANFCDKCGKFVNPLGLPQFQSECECSMSSPTGSTTLSPKKEIFNRQQITTPTATPSLAPPTAPLDMNPADEEHTNVLRSSNLSVGSLKFSFSEDTEQFFAESFNDVAKMSSEIEGVALVDEQQHQQDQKRDSLPIAVISSAVDSFTQEDNLDQIIKDINRSSSSHSLLKGNTPEERMDNGSMGSFAATGSTSSGGNMSDLNNLGRVQIEPTTTNSLDFDVDELDELTKYFLSENDAAVVVQREMQANLVLMQQNPPVMTQNPQFKKIHSLDFDSDNTMTGSSSRSGIVMSEVKLEDTEMMDPFLATLCLQILHGDYYRVRIENLQHRCKGVCRAPVKAHVSIPAPAGSSVVQPGLVVLARCNSTFSRNMTLTEQQLLNLPEMKSLQGVSAVGVIDNFAPLTNGGVQFDVTFHPDVWKFEFDLPKKRRHVQSSSPAVSSHGADDAGGDPLTAEFLYFFEIDVFYSREKTIFERLGHTESMNFQIGNTRTLLRQRNKMVEEFNSSGGPQVRAGQNDSDRLADADELPEKKRVKVNKGRHEMLSGTSFGEDGLGSRGLSGSKLSIGYITGEGISSSSKRNLLEDKNAPMDVDGYFRTDSKDSIFDCEAGSSDLPKVKADVWKDVDGDSEDLQQAATSDYRPYVSPKQKSDKLQTAESPVATAIPIKVNTHARPAIPASSTKEAHSLPKLLAYSFVCVPLSVLFIPVGILLLLGLLVVPPAASGIVGALDALSDMELSRANSSCNSSDQRMVLNRLVEENVDSSGKPKGGMFRYHGKGEVWGRIFYFSGAKFVVSMVSLMPAFVLALFAGLLYPIRPASAAIADAACGCALWSREYTRETTGKPLAGATQYDEMGGLV
ncbi:hypothetical protein GQ600_7267 [Phytophthora cactorum]|nr:hypothetical protein GQ600_7267 [Phytophthora cactorum]